MVVRRKLKGESSGHDWWHIYRVWKMLSASRGTQGQTYSLFNLLRFYVVADWTLHDGDETLGPQLVAASRRGRHTSVI